MYDDKALDTGVRCGYNQAVDDFLEMLEEFHEQHIDKDQLIQDIEALRNERG